MSSAVYLHMPPLVAEAKKIALQPAIAPCAKLTAPDPFWIRTMPSAISA